MEATSLIQDLNGALTGRYLIQREIGRGGMATVYLARDLRHDRQVALKVLLAELGAILGPERFLSEIRVTANLQHPNLLPLFDSGEVNGRLFYVMPFVEGESLRQRLEREKQLPIDEAVRITTACASALGYAHKRDVIHRDLKPENILLSAGQPVIADFGIALAVSNAGGARITQTGLSLGTPQYMSPEQAAGDRDVDRRSDIYSLGCVLYEMLTGDPPLTGSTVQAIVAKVLVEKPRSVRLQRERVPVHVDAALERALAKLPADRWATAEEFCAALTDPAVTASMEQSASRAVPATTYTSAPARMRVLRHPLWPAIAVASAVVAGVALWKLRSVPEARPVTFVIPTPPNAKLAVDPSYVLFAPDGRSIVYAAAVSGGRRLYLRRLDEVTAREIPGTDEASHPFLSPDGKWIAFGTPTGILSRVAISGGAPTQIARVREFRGGAWSRTGDIVFAGDSGLYRMSANGGTPQLFTVRDTAKAELAHAQPMFLPDERTVVFRIDDAVSRANNRLAVASVDRRGHELLGVAGGNPLAFLKGYLVFGRTSGFIAAVPFDARRARATGEPMVLLGDVSVFAGAAASLGDDGSLVYVRSGNASRLLLGDARGAVTPVHGEARRYFYPRLSPDGRHVAVHVSSAGANLADIWRYDLQGEVLSRVTSLSTSVRPEWTPDGRYITYRRLAAGKWEIWRAPPDGGGPETRYFAWRSSVLNLAFAPAGQFAVFGVEDPRTAADVWLLPLDNSGAPLEPRPLLTSSYNELAARISPDGRWLAYVSDESGRNEIYVRPFPGSGARVQVSTAGGAEPMWTSNSEIVYRADGKFRAATVSAGGSLAVSARREVFDDEYLVHSGFSFPQYDVSRDGKRFALLQSVGNQEIVVMLNSLERLLSAAAER